MKAIILNQPKDFSIKEIDKPQIKDDEVLIRVKASESVQMMSEILMEYSSQLSKNRWT